MFRSITLHGVSATLVWGYRTAVRLRAWRIVHTVSGWTLTGTITSVDHYCTRKTPLYFVAPREKGQWCWPVAGELVITGTLLEAPLGQPEQ